MGNDKNNAKKRKRNYETVGRTKSIFTVNFEHSKEILDLIDPLFENRRYRDQLFRLASGIFEHLNADDNLTNGIEIATQVIQSTDKNTITAVDTTFFLKTFCTFFSDLPILQQTVVYKFLGEQLNPILYEQSQKGSSMEEIDITKLLNSSGKDLYEDTDPRLTGFIEEAVSTVYTDKFGSDVAKIKKASFCHNIVENFLKARNLRFVSLFGLSLLTLVYIFSGRSLQTCNMFSATGAKGTHKIVTNYVLPNSKETSYRPCADGVTVYYSNVQYVL